MKIIAGVDIGNSTTEVCLGRVDQGGSLTFLGSLQRPTSGTKGTVENVVGVRLALLELLEKLHMETKEVDFIRINEAAPVIGDTAMETITETIITGSSMIGHDPSTPAGAGVAVGKLIAIDELFLAEADCPYIVVVKDSCGYEKAASILNEAAARLSIAGVILQADEAVLVKNRLHFSVPIVDEVKNISEVPQGKLAAIEVALAGDCVRMLSNPYGIATLLGLDAEETKKVTPIAKSLVGKRSAVVIKTPHGNVKENILPAGKIYIRGRDELRQDMEEETSDVDIDEGADIIMQVLKKAGEISDITGQPSTNVGHMFQKIKEEMSSVSGEDKEQIKITDILAVDTLAPLPVAGALAGETCLEKAVGIAAMVKTHHLPMEKIANELRRQILIPVKVAGVEAVMASLGALTTPGTRLPLAILDMGGGSTDAALMTEEGKVYTTHKAGAGELVTMLIQTELGLRDRITAEEIKKYPLARVESLFHMRLESGAMHFFEESIDPKYFGSVVLLEPDCMIKIEEDIPMEKIVQVRREAKKKVFLTNAIRALEEIAPDHKLRNIPNVVLVGGSAKDFEIPQMLMEEFANYKIVCGRGNIRGCQGPENAVATGLVMSYAGEKNDY